MVLKELWKNIFGVSRSTADHNDRFLEVPTTCSTAAALERTHKAFKIDEKEDAWSSISSRKILRSPILLNPFPILLPNVLEQDRSLTDSFFSQNYSSHYVEQQFPTRPSATNDTCLVDEKESQKIWLLVYGSHDRHVDASPLDYPLTPCKVISKKSPTQVSFSPTITVHPFFPHESILSSARHLPLKAQRPNKKKTRSRERHCIKT